MHTITSSPSRLLRWHLVATLNTPTTPSTTTTTTTIHIPPTSTPKLKPCTSSTSSKAIMNPDATSLLSTWSHRAWVAAGSTTILIALTNSVATSIKSGTIVEPVISALAGYAMADLGTGFYHFAVDNYGGASTPIFGPQIEAFQGHHRRPTTIARRQPANNLHALARAVTFFLLPLEVLTSVLGGSGAGMQAFVGACAGCVMMSQQFHAWAHERKDRLPWWVEGLQRAGVLISRDMHGVHHRQPYDSNYCIVSGLWNGVLDEYGVFKAVEMVVFFKFGVRPRSWGQTSVEWREEEDVD